MVNTDIGSYLLTYMDGWSRGAQDKPPRFPDPTYRKGHQDGLRDRYRAIEQECERIGVPMTLETARSLIAESHPVTPASETDRDRERDISITLAPLDPMETRFSEIRAEYLRQMDVPSGAVIDHEFNEDGSKRHGTAPYRSDAVKHYAPRDEPPAMPPSPAVPLASVTRGVPSSVSNGHGYGHGHDDDLVNEFGLG